MDNTTARAVEQALELLKAGKKADAHAILAPLIRQNPDIAEAWYLLGFTMTDPDKRLYSFQQVLRIDPSNQAAQKQIAKLRSAPPAAPAVLPPAAAPFAERRSAPASMPWSSSEMGQEQGGTGMPWSMPASNPEPASTTATPWTMPFGEPEPAVAPVSRKPAKKVDRGLVVGIVLSVVVILALGGGLALYIGNGMQTSSQVDALFAQRKCTEVVQYASFSRSFPRSIFSSLFSAFHEVDECQAELSLEQALKAQDWPAADNIIGNYLTTYPSGAFAQQMRDQATDVLLAWSKNLVAASDYRTAIEKLKLIQSGYPNSPAVPVALETMFDDYMLWAKASFEQKDYKAAEQTLKQITSHPQASPARVQQANVGLAGVYLQWGKTEIDDGDFDSAIQHYEQAKTLAPDLTDYDRLNDQVTLMHAVSLSKANDFDGALAEIKSLAEATQSEDTKSDAAATQAQVLNDYSHSDSEQAKAVMSAAALNVCQQQPAGMSIFGLDANEIRIALVSPYNPQLPDQWLATTPAQLHYVLCIEEKQVTIQSCPYTGGHVLRRKRLDWSLTLYEILTGSRYKTTKLTGGKPSGCPAYDYFASGLATKDVYGSRPTADQVVSWLTALKLTK